ncbi:ATP-binding response regulator [Piscirickettsia litoralis]|uniref:Response regulator n=1 Tax=Piscirickettsia litoralis TaxID=1891921 RepID=A0ABX3A818_9GAMM|nr:response regulator [Piscirickettsia litoralis]ODN42254.1 response regulator [Piscirickettsia litoralis]
MPSLLLVDDESHIVDALKRLFRREKYTLFCAYNASEGLNILEQEKIDVILSDQRMPNMLGSEFLQRAQEKFPETIRVILSGYSDTKEIISGVLNGSIHQFLEKPWRANELREHIRYLINKTMTPEASPGDDHTLTAAFSFNSEGQLKSVNSYFCNLLDQSEEVVLTKPLTSVINYSQTQFEEILSHVQDHGHWHGKVTLNNQNKTHLMMSLAILEKEHAELIYGSLLTSTNSDHQ